MDKEKRAILRRWSKREKQIEQVILNTVCMYWDFEGIIGGALLEVEGMSMLQLEGQ